MSLFDVLGSNVQNKCEIDTQQQGQKSWSLTTFRS